MTANEKLRKSWGVSMGEKRKFMRFNVLMKAVCRAEGSLRKVQIGNVSREGIGIFSRDLFETGEDLEIELMIPGDNVPVLFEGEIVWASGPAADTAQHRSGIKFTRISNDDRSRILEYIYQQWIMSDKSGNKTS